MAVIDAVDRYLGSDPGGERVRTAANGAIAVLAAIGASALLDARFHMFEVAASAPGAGVINHVASLLVLILGASVALTASFVVGERTGRARALTTLIACLGMWAGLSLAIAVHPHRLLGLVLLVAVPSVGAWFRRYGVRAFATGFPIHVGYLIGFLAGGEIGVDQLAWPGAVIGVAGAATFVVGLALLPGYAHATARMQRSYRARARRVLAVTGALMDAPVHTPADHRLARRLRRLVVRLNETALVLDTRLATTSADDNDTAARDRRRSLFEHERAVVTLARLAQRHAHRQLSGAARADARAVVAAAGELDLAALERAAYRFRRYRPADPVPSSGSREDHGIDAAGVPGGAGEIAERYQEAACALVSAISSTDADPHAQQEPRPVVHLIAGWLPGSGIVNATASSRKGTARVDRLSLTVSTRVSLQLAVALGLAVFFGDMLSPSHLLWAVVSVYVTFLGSASDREQLRKSVFRVLGTVAGVVAGDGLARLTGTQPVASMAVVVVAAFLMSYFGRINYALVVGAATLGVAQFYSQAGELTSSLLATRVEETAVGAACAIVVGLAVLPLRTTHAAQVGLAGYLRALAQVLDGLLAPGGPTAGHSARTDTRVLDAGFHAATATIRPLVRTLLGGAGHRCPETLRLVDLSHELGRTIVHDSSVLAHRGNDLTELTGITHRAASAARAVADDLDGRVVGQEDGPPAPSPADAPEPVRSERQTPVTGSLRAELEDIEGVLTELALMRGLAIPDVAVAAPGHGRPRPGRAAVLSRPAGTTGVPAVPAVTATPSLSRNAVTATVSGALRCPLHPDGCEAWITVVTDRGRRWTQARAENGLYRIAGLPPGGYTLIASAVQHAPHAEFLLVEGAGREISHDIALDPAR
ncbi:FUSC family protein [Streptomyces sp. NPDC090499]|uniref:FUSC family protein n=1 Tax=Streptomyces sp. NPDC090499 TaxID=3365965 RepID=UPI00380BDCC1